MNSEFCNLPLLSQNQSIKEVTIEVLARLDCLINKVVKTKSKDLGMVPEEGDVIIISGSENEELKRYENYIAYYFDNNWGFIKPKSGMIFFIISEARFNIYLNGKWKALESEGKADKEAV